MRDTSIRFAMAPLAAVGLVAGFLMLMVALGLLGVLWQNVTQRTREIGLRRAKGAARSTSSGRSSARSLVMTSLALLAGVLVAIQFPLLDIIDFVEPHVYAIGLAISVSAIYLLTLACACYPSRLATRVQPPRRCATSSMARTRHLNRNSMILIVDDDPSVTASLALLLKQAGLRQPLGGVAGRGAGLARRAPVRAGAAGHELHPPHDRRGRAGPAGAHQGAAAGLPVILITAWGSIQLAVEGMKAGAADFITKPWTNEQILQAVRTALGLAASTRRRRPAWDRARSSTPASTSATWSARTRGCCASCS